MSGDIKGQLVLKRFCEKNFDCDGIFRQIASWLIKSGGFFY